MSNNLKDLLSFKLVSLASEVKFEIHSNYKQASHVQAKAPLHWNLVTKTDPKTQEVYQRLSFKDSEGKVYNYRLRNLAEASKAAINVWKLNGQWSDELPKSPLDRLIPHVNYSFVRPIKERIEGTVTTERGSFDWWIVESNGKLLGSHDNSSYPLRIRKIANVEDLIQDGIDKTPIKPLEVAPLPAVGAAATYTGSVLLVWAMIPETITYYLFPEDHPMVSDIAASAGAFANADVIEEDHPFWKVSSFIDNEGSIFKVDSPTVTGNIKAVHTAGWYL